MLLLFEGIEPFDDKIELFVKAQKLLRRQKFLKPQKDLDFIWIASALPVLFCVHRSVTGAYFLVLTLMVWNSFSNPSALLKTCGSMAIVLSE